MTSTPPCVHTCPSKALLDLAMGAPHSMREGVLGALLGVLRSGEQQQQQQHEQSLGGSCDESALRVVAASFTEAVLEGQGLRHGGGAAFRDDLLQFVRVARPALQ